MNLVSGNINYLQILEGISWTTGVKLEWDG